MAEKKFMKSMEMQLLKKTNASLESKVNKFEDEKSKLKEKIAKLEDKNLTLSESLMSGENESILKISLNDIKITTNIRDQYDYEEIENLAIDILLNGQLQPVLLTNDNFLLAGYRRYHAFKLIIESPEKLQIPNNIKDKIDENINDIVAYKIDKNLEEINNEELEDLQFAENYQRRSIDNFQLSKLFNSYIEKGYDQKYISEKFKKSKGIVSSIINLKNIDAKLVNFIKEFQVFGWSKEKFSAENPIENDDKKLQFYNNKRGIVGWKPLYEIAKQKSILDMKKTFLKNYKERLSEAELKSEYFSEVLRGEPKKKNNENNIKKILTKIKGVSKLTEGFPEGEEYQSIKNDLEKLIIKLEQI